MPPGQYALSLPVVQNSGMDYRGDPRTGNLGAVSVEIMLNGRPVPLEFTGPLRLVAPHGDYGGFGQTVRSQAALSLSPGDRLTVKATGWSALGPVTLTPQRG
jgi:hypothetical protein